MFAVIKVITDHGFPQGTECRAKFVTKSEADAYVEQKKEVAQNTFNALREYIENYVNNMPENIIIPMVNVFLRQEFSDKSRHLVAAYLVKYCLKQYRKGKQENLMDDLLPDFNPPGMEYNDFDNLYVTEI